MSIEQKLESLGYVVGSPFTVLGEERIIGEKVVDKVGMIHLTYNRNGDFRQNQITCNWADIKESTKLMGIAWSDIESLKHMK